MCKYDQNTPNEILKAIIKIFLKNMPPLNLHKKRNKQATNSSLCCIDPAPYCGRGALLNF